MNGKHTLPADIRRTNVAIITQELAAAGIELPPQHRRRGEAGDHTTADFDLCAKPALHARRRCRAALRRCGRACDAIANGYQYGKAGVSKPSLAKLGGTVACFMADRDMAPRRFGNQHHRGRTRPWEKAAREYPARCFGRGKRAYGSAAPGGADRGRAAAGAGRGGARGLCECGGGKGAHLRRVQGGGRSSHSLHGPQRAAAAM